MNQCSSDVASFSHRSSGKYERNAQANDAAYKGTHHQTPLRAVNTQKGTISIQVNHRR